MATSGGEREAFLRDLQTFHEARGTPFRRFPTVGGREVDLHLLYTLVTAQGGWIKVNSKNAWDELFLHFKLPTKCVNGGVALKQLYLRYLDRWEKIHFLGEEADRGSDEDEESRHKRWSARVLHTVPLSYNYYQHNVAESNRDYNHMSTQLYKASDYDKLALSLICPLPNEQDFAVNVCTLLSNDGKHTLKLDKHPRIINFLLGHAGVYSHSSLRNLFIHNYNLVRKRPIHNFWEDVLESEEFLDLTKEDKFNSSGKKPVSGVDGPDKTDIAKNSSSCECEIKVDDSVIVCDSVETDADCEIISECSDKTQPNKKVKLKFEPIDKELFCLGRSLGTQEYIGQRVLQVATIFRNLSFIEENVHILVKNKTFVRFMLLCATSQWSHLKNLGLDMLGNVALDLVVKDFPNDLLASILLKIISHGLNSNDRLCCISSLEVLNKLSQSECNEDALLRNLESSVYHRVCSFLTIHDVMLLIYTLECLYSLSSLGERSCNFIVNNHGVVDTLVSLVTVEGKSYGPKACIGMKLVETVSGATPATTSQSQSTPASSVNNAAPVTTTAATSIATTSLAASSTTSSKTLTPATPSRPVQIHPVRLIPPSPVTTPIIASSISTSTVTTSPVISLASQTMSSSMPSPPAAPLTPQQLIQQQHAHQQAIHENEQFALAWLRATYEPSASGGKVDHQELYRHYMNTCAKIGRKGVISPLHFPRCVRSVFGGTVGPNPMKPSRPSEPQYYEGIKVRATPLALNLPPEPSPALPPVTVQRRRPRSPLTSLGAGDGDSSSHPAAGPSSPILKAQLSAPCKKEGGTASAAIASNAVAAAQAISHPHLSQALLGTGSASCAATAASNTQSSIGGGGGMVKEGQSNTSLIKSLLATKVNDCMVPAGSMRTAANDCPNVAPQVAARQQQQRLLAQQSGSTLTPVKQETSKCRVNGARQLFNDNELGDPCVSSTTQFTSLIKGKREPPQPPPPPLAPLTSVKLTKSPGNENDDSDSLGNNSLASSTGLGTAIGTISSTDDGDNSLTSFEGLLNGIPNIDNPLNDDSNSDSVKVVGSNEILKNKPLRLADLLEKKVERPTMLLNGALSKDLAMNDKNSIDLVENHIEKALGQTPEPMHVTDESGDFKNLEMKEKQGVKRPATDDVFESEPKKPLLSNNMNGSNSAADSPAPESISSSNGDEGPSTVSTAAAKLFADIAADILEDEDEEQLLQEAQCVAQPGDVASIQGNPIQQIVVDNNQQMILTQRPIIVSQGAMSQTNTVVFSQGMPIKTQSGQTVIVQSAGQRPQMMLQSSNQLILPQGTQMQPNSGQLLLSQGASMQSVQLVTSGGSPAQYVLQAGGPPGAYVVAQQQTAVVHGQPQTVLVAQTPQQQGTATKTIIILQQQHSGSTGAHHQKVVVTPHPQGQQMVVTQVPRPVMQTASTAINSNAAQAQSVIKANPSISTATTTVSQSTNTNGPSMAMEIKEEDAGKIQSTSPPVQVKLQPVKTIVRDLSNPFVCEWADCTTETKFKTANQVYMHACEVHCPQNGEEVICQWERCDNLKRKRFSLMTHLHDKHCNTETMKQSLIRRKQLSHSNKTEPQQQPSTTPHPGYAPDAALHAIKRHALEFVNPKELQDDNEGPVTKSIRLTASLILRNLVIYSGNCRRYLKPYESHLANVALSNVESSRTIAQVLYDMNESSTHR